MAQRIQAPLNAGLCLIISREGLSMVPQKKRPGECDRRRQKNRAEERLKAREKQVQDLVGGMGGEKKERKTCPCGHVIPLLRWLLCV